MVDQRGNKSKAANQCGITGKHRRKASITNMHPPAHKPEFK